MTWLVKNLIPDRGLVLLVGHRCPEVGVYFVDRLRDRGHNARMLVLDADGKSDEFEQALILAQTMTVFVASPDPNLGLTVMMRFADVVIACGRDSYVSATKGAGPRRIEQNYKGVVVEPRTMEAQL